MLTITFQGVNFDDIKQQMQDVLQQLQNPPRTEGEVAQPTILERAEAAVRKFKVVLSPYPDINPGDVGWLEKAHSNGYALVFKQPFSTADNPARRDQTRVVFFAEHQVEEIK